jgi:hypothetical protein
MPSLDECLKQMGFGIEALNGGGMYFHVHEHADWVERNPVEPDPK